MSISEQVDLKDPNHPQWVRRRQRLTLMFMSGLAGFMAYAGVGFYRFLMGTPLDPNLMEVLIALFSMCAAAVGIYTWQGVKRND